MKNNLKNNMCIIEIPSLYTWNTVNQPYFSKHTQQEDKKEKKSEQSYFRYGENFSRLDGRSSQLHSLKLKPKS